MVSATLREVDAARDGECIGSAGPVDGDLTGGRSDFPGGVDELGISPLAARHERGQRSAARVHAVLVCSRAGRAAAHMCPARRVLRLRPHQGAQHRW